MLAVRRKSYLPRMDTAETSADYPTFFVYGVPCPVSPEDTASLLEALESSGSHVALAAAGTIVAAVSAGRRIELSDAESLELIRILERQPLGGYLASLRAQLVAWRDLA